MDKQQFLDLEGLNILVSEILKKMDNNGKVMTYQNHFIFPGIGKENIIYIDQDNNSVYRWDDENVKYYRVGSNYEDIQFINGGDANQ